MALVNIVGTRDTGMLRLQSSVDPAHH